MCIRKFVNGMKKWLIEYLLAPLLIARNKERKIIKANKQIKAWRKKKLNINAQIVIFFNK